MSNLYEINEQILGCIDIDTGEIVDFDRLSGLQIERDTKIENIGLWVKNLLADAEAYKREKDAFAEKERVAKNKADGLKAYLAAALSGEKYKSTRLTITYRKSEAVHIDDETGFVEYAQKNGFDDLLTYKSPTPNKTAIKEAIKGGTVINGVSLEQRQSLQIK